MSALIESDHEFEPVIGLEIHAELQIRSKMFCGCDADHNSAQEPNINICPICLGLPGAMPVLNQKALEMGILAGLALNCQINESNIFARKNYFYPDLPKGYQISQFDHPVASNGWLEISTGTEENKQRVRIRRVHLEEDTAKLSHEKKYTLIDFNRSGVPLLEIVSEPDMYSIDSALDYAQKIRTVLRYLNVNSGDMEKGVLRFEANISLRRRGSQALNTRTEIKNLNSFKAMSLAIEYEITRQANLLASNIEISQETLGWDEASGKTYPQRGKEESHDYRYYPEPDIPPIHVSESTINLLRKQLPELPMQRLSRFIQEYGFSTSEAQGLIIDKRLADFFEETVKLSSSPLKMIYTWIIGVLTGYLNERKLTFEVSPVNPLRFAHLVDQYSSGRINDFTAKEILKELFFTNKDPEEIINERNLGQISDKKFLANKIDIILENNPEQVQEYHQGKTSLFQWFMGQVSRETHGKSDPKVVRKLLIEALLKRNKE